MKNKTLLLVVLAGMTMTGCLVSALHPFYTDKDKVFDPDMIGEWMDTDSARWTIEKHTTSESFMGPDVDDSTYLVTYQEEDAKKAILQGTLFQLNGVRYVDFFPAPDEDQGMSDMTSYHHIPAHTLARISFNEDTMMLYWYGEDWLNDLFEQNKIHIEHETVEISGEYSRHVLTASTEELQKFIVRYANEPATAREIESLFAGGEQEDHKFGAFLKLVPVSGPANE